MQRESGSNLPCQDGALRQNCKFCITCTHLAVIRNAVSTNSGTIAAPAKTHPNRRAFSDDGCCGTMPHLPNNDKKKTDPLKGQPLSFNHAQNAPYFPNKSHLHRSTARHPFLYQRIINNKRAVWTKLKAESIRAGSAAGLFFRCDIGA